MAIQQALNGDLRVARAEATYQAALAAGIDKDMAMIQYGRAWRAEVARQKSWQERQVINEGWDPEPGGEHDRCDSAA